MCNKLAAEIENKLDLETRTLILLSNTTKARESIIAHETGGRYLAKRDPAQSPQLLIAGDRKSGTLEQQKLLIDLLCEHFAKAFQIPQRLEANHTATKKSYQNTYLYATGSYYKPSPPVVI